MLACHDMTHQVCTLTTMDNTSQYTSQSQHCSSCSADSTDRHMWGASRGRTALPET